MSVAALVALLIAAPAAAFDCGLARPEACGNTNLLVGDRAFRPAIRAFLGDGQANYIYRGRLAEQQVSVLGGPPDEPGRIGGLYRFTACRAHSCDEKGAVVLEPQGRIVATAILHRSCLDAGKPGDCTGRTTLTLFIREPLRHRPVIDDLTTWAKARLETGRLEVVEVYAAGDGAPRPISRELNRPE